MNLKPTLLLTLLLCCRGSLSAQTVNWGTSVAINTALTNQSFTSTGAGMTAAITWDLGYFTPGFTPTASNPSDWNLNWISVAGPTRTIEAAPDYVVSGWTPDTNATAYGKQAYIWAYSDKTQMGVPGQEALLVTVGDWQFPASGTADFDIADTPFFAGDDNMTVVWGRVDRVVDGVGGVIQGAGHFDTTYADSTSYDNATFEVQTGGWAAAPVPEPSSLIVAALGLFGIFGRRKRS